MNPEVFVGRQEELQTLQALFKKRATSLVVVKGRRRVGKTRLLEEFAKNKKSYFFRGLAPTDKTTAQDQRDNFSRQLSTMTGLPEITVNDWSKLFLLLARETKTGRVIILLDEISWMGSLDSNFVSQLKDAWDTYFKKNPHLTLIVCGSISTWIDENIINSTGFYGRISLTITLNPLPLNDANQLLELQGFKSSVYEKFKILSVTGGVPWYIEQMIGGYSAEENIKRQCFTPSGALFAEYDRIFKELFGKQDTLYKKFVKALIAGPLEYHEISTAAEYKSSGRLSHYLENLIEAGFITRDFIWNLKNGKQSDISHFRLSDNYLRFYLKYIEKKRAQIERGLFQDVALSSLPGWEAIMGLQFENLIINNRDILLKRLNIRKENIIYDNPYWKKATKTMPGCQIDYLIQTKYKNIYICEIKFSRNKVNSKIIEDVKQKSACLALPKNTAILPVLIHVNGVQESVLDCQFFYEIIDFGDLLR